MHANALFYRQGDRRAVPPAQAPRPHEAAGSPVERVLRLARRLFDVPVAAVFFLKEGEPGDLFFEGIEPERAAAFCTLITALMPPGEVRAVETMTTPPLDETTAGLAERLGVGFYAAARFASQDGSSQGVLCVAGPHPHRMDPDDQAALADLAGLMVDEIAARRTALKGWVAEQALRAREAILEAASFAADQLLRSSSWHDCIDPVLRRLAAATEASRIYLFENHTDDDGTLLASQRFEYVADGITPELDNPSLQNMSYEAVGMGRWAEILGQGKPVSGLVRDFPAAEAAFLRAQEIRSLAVVPIFVRDAWLGFIGFDDCVRERRWTEAEIEALRVVAATLGAAILRMRHEDALRESEHRYRTLVEEASDGIFVGLLEGCFLEVNTRACELTGYRRSELLAMRPDDLLTPRSLEQRETVWPRLLEGQSLQFEREFLRKDGTALPVEVSIKLIDEALVQAIVRDISARKHYEEQLIGAKEQAEEMVRLKSALLTNMSHEIRTPLTAIIGFTDLLSHQVPPENHELIAIIRQNGERLLATLNSVLDLAQLESGSLRLRPTPLDLAESAEAALAMIRPQALTKNLALYLDAPASLPATLDRGALDRILANLLSNAVKFTDTGQIDLRVSAHEGEIEIRVRDTGVGIDPVFLPHIFDEFKQESSGVARTHEGNGLGLTITRRLVSLMRGTIHAESHKGAGTTFTVRLPRHLPE